MWSVTPLLMLLGCSDPVECTSLRLDAETPNHVQPYQVALDLEARRAYSTCLGKGTVAEVDLDSRSLVTVHAVADRALSVPDLAVDGEGIVWVTSQEPPALIRLEPAAGERVQIRAPLERAAGLVALAEGGAVVLGSDEEGQRYLTRFEADGAVGSQTALDGGGEILALDDAVGVIDGATLSIFALDALTLQETCALPFDARSGAALPDGSIVVAADHRIGRAQCGDIEPWELALGEENADVLSIDGLALVLDRIGGDGDDPNFGVGRQISPDGTPQIRFVTGKNSGFGAYDPEDGWVWMNSEGTTELWAMDPATGALEATVPLGSFLDGLAVDPSQAGVYVATGRLSDALVRIEGGEIVASTDEIFWPFSPQIVGGDLWVMSQADATLHRLDLETLELERSFAFGLDPNPLLTFGSLAHHPERGSMLFADSHADVLIELDAESGDERGRWSLGGPLIEDPDAIGQLLVIPWGADVLIARSNDARLQRVALDSGALESRWLEDPVLEALASNAVDFAWLDPEADALYLGGYAVDPGALERLPEQDLEVYRMIGGHPSREGHRVAVSADRRSLVRVTPGGRLRTITGFAQRDLHASVFRLDAAGGDAVLARSQDAYVCPFEL